MSSTKFNYERPQSKRWLRALIIATTILAITGAFVLDEISFLETRRSSLDQFNIQQLTLARAAASAIEARYREIINILSASSRSVLFSEMSIDSLAPIYSTGEFFSPFSSLRVLDKNGTLRLIYPLNEWRRDLIGRDYSRKVYFQKVLATGQFGGCTVETNERMEKRIRVAVPIYQSLEPGQGKTADTSKLQGVLVGSFDLRHFFAEFVSKFEPDKIGCLSVLDQNGILLSHADQTLIGKNIFEIDPNQIPNKHRQAFDWILQQRISGGEGIEACVSSWFHKKDGEVERLHAYTPANIKDTTWSVAVCSPVSKVEDIIAKARRSHSITLGFVMLAMLTAGALLLTMSYRWSRTLEGNVLARTKELKQTRDYLDKLIKHATSPIMVWDTDKRVTMFNRAFEKMSGRSAAEMIGSQIDALFPDENRDWCMEKIESASNGNYLEAIEIPILNKYGNVLFALWNSTNVYDEDGTLLGTIALGQDITGRIKAEQELKASLREKEVLLKEVHHRVKNNMQLISSFFKIKSRRLPPLPHDAPSGEHAQRAQVFDILEESQGIIRSISLVHEKLYQSKDLARVDFKDYVKTLTAKLFQTYSTGIEGVEFEVEVGDVYLGVDSAIPCTLVLNELISNALKHAFPEGRKGNLKVMFQQVAENEMELTVSDDGIGMPENLDFRGSESFGLHLVTILVEDQLKGEIELDRTEGTSIHIRFTPLSKA